MLHRIRKKNYYAVTHGSQKRAPDFFYVLSVAPRLDFLTLALSLVFSAQEFLLGCWEGTCAVHILAASLTSAY